MTNHPNLWIAYQYEMILAAYIPTTGAQVGLQYLYQHSSLDDNKA